MSSSVLNLPLDDVAARRVEPFPFFKDNILFTGVEMFSWLNNKHPSWTLDVLTYTATPTVRLKNRIRRLVCAIREPGVVADHYRLVANVHTKLYLCYSNAREKTVCAFVGSQNLSAPTNENLMVRVDSPVSLKLLDTYFNHFWK
jgi:hypothetical protein